MKVLVELEDGRKVELHELKVLPPGDGVIVIRTNLTHFPQDEKLLERRLSKKFGRPVVILGPAFGEILVVPSEGK